MNSLNTCSVQAFQYHEETSHKVNRGQKATDLNCFIHTHGLHRQQQLLVTSLKICTELVAPVRISPSLKILSIMFDFTVFFSHFHHLHIEKCYFLFIWSPGNLIVSSEYSRHDFRPQQLKTEKMNVTIQAVQGLPKYLIIFRLPNRTPSPQNIHES